MHTPFMDRSPRRRDNAGGRLKQRLAQILTRSSCTTNTTSAGASADTAFVSLARAGADSSPRQPEAPPSPYFCTPCTYERPRADGLQRRRTRSASLVHISVDCTGGAAAASGRRSVLSDAPLLQHLSVPARDVRKRGKGGGRGKPAARSPSASRRHLSSSSSSWGRARRPRSTPAPYSWSPSSSSSATDDEVAPFSSSDGEAGGEEAQTRTLFSSLSLSSDSSEFYRSSTRKSHWSTIARRAPWRALPRTGEAAPGDAFRLLVLLETRKHRGPTSFKGD